MSDVKQLLKEARKSLESLDTELALSFLKEVFEIDKNNYLALIFQGKAYFLANDVEKALKSFKRATALDENNLLGWKGYFQVLRSQLDYQGFFDIAAKLARKQSEQDIGIADTLNEIWNYLKQNHYKKNDRLMATFLRNTLPGSELGDVVGDALGKQVINLQNLIALVKKHEESEVSKSLKDEQMKLPRVLTQEQKKYLDSVAWSFYKDSDLSSLYDLYLNMCNEDNALREEIKEEYLKYLYKLLVLSPDKTDLKNQIEDMLEGMVITKTKSLFCWTLYFDWQDAASIADLDRSNLIFFLQNFKDEGLGLIIYSYLQSDQSLIPASEVLDKITSSKKEGKKLGANSNVRQLADSSEQIYEVGDDNDDSLVQSGDSKIVVADSSSCHLSSQEILAQMTFGIQTSKDSLLAYRIVGSYSIYLHVYTEALNNCRNAIKLLADLERSTEIGLSNTKENISCDLAICYTYYEAPKNYTRALQIYDRVLAMNADNVTSQRGKASILIEQDKLSEAEALLGNIIKEFPKDGQVLLDYAWCEIKLGNISQGQQTLAQALPMLIGNDSFKRELRAKCHWRMAYCQLISANPTEKEIHNAHEHLISSLKESKVYAPSYTLLGRVYQDYFDDIKRAQKCFYRALELDESEILATYYLVKDLADRNEWEVCEILCKRILESDHAKRSLLLNANSEFESSWPYVVLGYAASDRQDDQEAVKWLQAALRISPENWEGWIAIGEAHFSSGRFEVAAKVFRHTLEMRDEWLSKFMLGQVCCELEEFEEGIQHLLDALEAMNSEFIISALYEGYIRYSNKLIKGGFFGRAIESSIKAFKFIKLAASKSKKSPLLWKALSDCLKIFYVLQGFVDKFPFDEVISLLQEVTLEGNTNDDLQILLAEDDNLTIDAVKRLCLEDNKIKAISIAAVLAAKTPFSLCYTSQPKYVKSSMIYNLGLAYLDAFYILESDLYREFSIRCFKRAIKLESNTHRYWVALGNAYSSYNPHLSQHCYIKALSLQLCDTSIWCNLATLYLRYGDVELARETLMKAQAVAPQLSKSWLGFALLEQAMGNPEAASNLFKRAFIVSNESSPLEQLLYSLSVVNNKLSQPHIDAADIATMQEFGMANHAMKKYLKYYANDVPGLEVACSISERCHDYFSAIKLASKLSILLERKYEESESEAVLIKFIRTKASLARAYLGNGDYAHAIEASQFALALIPEDGDAGYSGNLNFSKERLSLRVVLGLSYFFIQNSKASLEEFRAILAIGNDMERIVILSAQILYACRVEASRTAAVEQLFTYLSDQSSSLAIVFTLAAISVVDNLIDYLPAIKDELLGLDLKKLSEDNHRSVPRLISEINNRLGSKEQLQIWQRSLTLFPADVELWKRLSLSVALQIGTSASSKLTSAEYTRLNIDSGKLRQIQRALMITAVDKRGAQALKGCF